MSRQLGVLPALPSSGHHRTWDLVGSPTLLRDALASFPLDEHVVIGLGLSFVTALGQSVPGLVDLAEIRRGDVFSPKTPHTLWAWTRGDSPEQAVSRMDHLEAALEPLVRRVDNIAVFKHQGGRDLTGFVDGTENPTGDDAVAAAFLADGPLAGSTFVATQRWAHDLVTFHRHPLPVQEAMIGRTRDEDLELEDAPPSAHIKRTAQESYDPKAFMLRRSMPFRDPGGEQGLFFVAFVADVEVFERQMRRMAGVDDGVVDALFSFSKIKTSASYWCPALRNGRLDLSAIGG